ncbi:hypothetical protein [Paenibacillus koleovorans]|uniref:hypothetical protein n=1 Tax=Paenibacillus koleovorans TaxID=121608 RepID=UPI000FD9717D|nr:hypothetical protein [Paenibacillus koleovorans]
MTETSSKVQPMAQDYTIVWHNPDVERYVEGCGLVRLDNGDLVAAVPVVPRFIWSKERRADQSRSHILKSADGGKEWQKIAEFNFYSAIPWVYEGALYLFANKGGTEYRNDDLLLLRSDDGGSTWTEPVTLFEGHFWNCHTGMVIRDHRLYWAIDDLGLGSAYEQPDDIRHGACRAPRAITGDLRRGPMDPGSWRMSNPVFFPEHTDALFNVRFAENASHYLEPNLIDVNGQLRMLATVKLKGQTTANLCAVADIADDGSKLDATFVQFSPMPGGHLKFCVIWDEVSCMFWATANLTVDSQKVFNWKIKEQGTEPDRVFAPLPGGDDRRFLMLFYGLDGMNWFQAGCVARAGQLTQSFMYAKPVIDGDDLVIISRSSVQAPNRHDADFAALHRVHHFRRLALDLYPDPN